MMHNPSSGTTRIEGRSLDRELVQESKVFLYLRSKLQEQFPDADEDTLLDTVEGMTNLHEILAEFVRSSLDDLTTSGALKQRIAEMKERLVRFETRADKKRAMHLG